MAQALSIISVIGDNINAKYARQPVPVYSENDEDFCQRYINYYLYRKSLNTSRPSNTSRGSEVGVVVKVKVHRFV